VSSGKSLPPSIAASRVPSSVTLWNVERQKQPFKPLRGPGPFLLEF